MEFTDITCPMCGLACDDLRIRVDQAGINLQEPSCALAERYFAAGWTDAAGSITARIDGKPVSFDDAIARAAELLAASRSALVSGLMTDVDGARAALALADRFGACIDHRDSEAQFRNLRVVQDSGWFNTTLTEVRNRASLVVIVGSNLLQSAPRFGERVLAPAGMFFEGRRKLVLLGEWNEDALAPELADCEVSVIQVPLQKVAQAAGILRMLCRGVAPALGTDLPLDALSALAQELKTTDYSTIAWSTADFAFNHAELAVESLSELVRDLNEYTRCGGLPLGGGDGGITSSQVCTWQSGFPPRTSFAAGHPEHDTIRYAADRMLREGEADLLVWLATLAPEAVPETSCPRIVIGHPATELQTAANVFLPAAIPGIDQAGHCFRTDGVVALPLRRLIEPRWRTARQIINQLLEASC